MEDIFEVLGDKEFEDFWDTYWEYVEDFWEDEGR